MNQTLDIEKLRTMFLKCNICTNDYDEGDHHPRIFPCLHGACYECVEKLLKNNCLQCPNCRKKYHVPGDNIDDVFLKDNTRRDLLNFVQVQDSSIVVCENCNDVSDSKKQAVNRCKMCSQFLCTECTAVHQKVKQFREHEVIRLDDLKNNTVNFEEFCHEGRCRIKGHDQSKLDLYCEECQVPVCTKCAFCNHPGHPISDIGRVFQDKKDLLIELLKNLDDVRVKQNNVITTIEMELRGLDSSVETAQKSIDSEMKKCVNAIQNRRKTHNVELIRIKEEKYKCLQQQQNDIQRLLDQTNQSCDFAQQALRYRNPSEFLLIVDTISGRLRELKETTFEDSPFQNSMVTFDSSGMLDKVEQVAKHLGTIRWMSAYLPYTEVEVPESLSVGSTEPVVIHLFNSERTPVNEMNVNISVQVADKLKDTVYNKNAVRKQTLLQEEQDKNTDDELFVSGPKDAQNAYYVLFTPEHTGEYVIRVKICGEPVAEEFTIKIHEKMEDSIKEPHTYQTENIDVDKISEELLKCNVCNEAFDTAKHIARTLPCLHQMGESCLDQKSVDDKVTCPKCDEEHAGKETFPINVLFNSVSSACLAQHIQQTQLQDPEKAMTSLDTSLTYVDEQVHIATCMEPDHEKQPFVLYCNECKQSLCVLCSLTHFNEYDHQKYTKQVKDVYKRRIEETKENMEGVRKRIKDTEEVISVITREKQLSSDIAESVTKEISKIFAEYEQMLNNRKSKLIDEAEKAKCNKENVLQEQIDEWMEDLNELKDSLCIGELSVSIRNPPAFLMIQEVLNNRLKSLCEETIDGCPWVSSHLSFAAGQCDNLITNIGSIHHTTAYLPGTEITFPKDILVNRRITMTISLFDIEERPATGTASNVYVKILDGEKKDEKLDIKLKEKNIYTCNWYPRKSGEHTIHAEIETDSGPVCSKTFQCCVKGQDTKESSSKSEDKKQTDSSDKKQTKEKEESEKKQADKSERKDSTTSASKSASDTKQQKQSESMEKDNLSVKSVEKTSSKSSENVSEKPVKSGNESKSTGKTEKKTEENRKPKAEGTSVDKTKKKDQETSFSKKPVIEGTSVDKAKKKEQEISPPETPVVVTDSESIKTPRLSTTSKDEMPEIKSEVVCKESSKSEKTIHGQTLQIFENVSKLEIGHFIDSPSFPVGEFSWRITFERTKEGYCGLFIYCDGTNNVKSWTCSSSVTLTIVPVDTRISPITSEYKKVFGTKEVLNWGFSKFCKWEELVDSSKGLIKDDKVSVSANITILSSSVNA